MKIININTEVCVADIENREGKKTFFRLLIQIWVTRKIFAEHEPRSVGGKYVKCAVRFLEDNKVI